MFNLALGKGLRPAAGVETLACEAGQCLAVRRVILTESLSVIGFLKSWHVCTTLTALRFSRKHTRFFLS